MEKEDRGAGFRRRVSITEGHSDKSLSVSGCEGNTCKRPLSEQLLTAMSSFK